MLGANLPKDYVNAFWEKAIPPESNVNKTEVIVAMAKAWQQKRGPTGIVKSQRW